MISLFCDGWSNWKKNTFSAYFLEGSSVSFISQKKQCEGETVSVPQSSRLEHLGKAELVITLISELRRNSYLLSVNSSLAHAQIDWYEECFSGMISLNQAIEFLF